jgi:hypothetical protein
MLRSACCQDYGFRAYGLVLMSNFPAQIHLALACVSCPDLLVLWCGYWCLSNVMNTVDADRLSGDVRLLMAVVLRDFVAAESVMGSGAAIIDTGHVLRPLIRLSYCRKAVVKRMAGLIAAAGSCRLAKLYSCGTLGRRPPPTSSPDTLLIRALNNLDAPIPPHILRS